MPCYWKKRHGIIHIFCCAQVTDVTSRSVTLQWSPPSDTGGVELTGYIIEKMLVESEKWEKAATVEPSVTLFTVDNLKVKFHNFRAKSEVNIKLSQL